jgi:DNA-binding NarL/FixJ family response regulator
MRVLVVDDHSLFRDGIISLLEAGGHEVVGEASNGAEAIKQALALNPELVLMDIHMPWMSGLDALKEIKEKLPTTFVVMLTVSEDDENLLEAIRLGANGYLLKQIDADEFFSLLERLQTGQAAISPAMATRLFKHLRQPPSTQPEPILSQRETEILRFVAAGKSNREIASILSVSENTIKFHIKNILQKLNVANRTEAATLAMQKRLL